MPDTPVIDIQGLEVGFTGRAGHTLPVLRGIDLQVRRGESVGLVGESGSGKSTLALAAMGYLKHGLRLLSGRVCFEGNDMFALNPAQLSAIRGGRLGLVPQNSGQSLTPTLRIGAQLHEALHLHCNLSEGEHDARVIDLLEQVRLPDPAAIATRFPHELSGGQQQRAAIAMALAGDPDALLLDEPTTGLDVTTQAHILELLRDLATNRNMAMVYVSHDLGAIARVCSQVLVMYAGEVVLEGPTAEVLRTPVHPYAHGLLASIPRLGDTNLPTALNGRPPVPGGVGDACSFAPRCGLRQAECTATRPLLEPAKGCGRVRCFRSADVGPLPEKGAGKAPLHPRHTGPVTLTLDDISISYTKPDLLDKIRKRPPPIPTVDGISLEITKGETLGLVGESGSGKSTILKTIAGLLPPQCGQITLDQGTPLTPRVEARAPGQLRRIQMIFQNPDDSLNPRHSVAEILAQPLRLYDGLSGQKLLDRSTQLLEQVRLGAHYLDRLPAQLSGGEKQRVAVARAFAAAPDLVLCDEVTSALDVSVQAAVLDLLNGLKAAQDTTYIFVSHDLAVVRALSDRVAVLYQGRLCEIGPADAVYATPSHPYTEVLMGAVLEPDPDTKPRLIADDAVDLSPPARGCPFQRRCPRKPGAVCDTHTPPTQITKEGHEIRCHIPLQDLQRLQRAADT